MALLFSCSSDEKGTIKDEAKSPAVENEEVQTSTKIDNKQYKIESGYVKYQSKAAGQDLIREVWFDDYGAKQYEENYMIFGDTKSGGKILIADGSMYSWNIGGNEGTKSVHRVSRATDFINLSKQTIERYGIVEVGKESIAGKTCSKFTTEKPMKSTVWIWEGIAMKTIAKSAGMEITSEAVEINTTKPDPNMFKIPDDVKFQENK